MVSSDFQISIHIYANYLGLDERKKYIYSHLIFDVSHSNEKKKKKTEASYQLRIMQNRL